jgi:glycosyltransferase involved in cell wall biosynthesis
MQGASRICAFKKYSGKPKMILCAGLQSGGTTLISWCFLQRKDISGELDMLTDTVKLDFNDCNTPWVWCKMTISSYRWLDVAQLYEDLGWSVSPLLIVRDVRVAFASLQGKGYGQNSNTAEDPPLKLRFRRFLRDWELFQHCNWPIIKFEQFANEPESTLMDACQKMGLPWDADMLNWPKSKADVFTRDEYNETFLDSLKEGVSFADIIHPTRISNFDGLHRDDLEWIETEFSDYNDILGYPKNVSKEIRERLYNGCLPISPDAARRVVTHRQFYERINQIQSEYNRVQSTRAVRIQRWLERHQNLSVILENIYDKGASFYKRQKTLLSTKYLSSKHSPELMIHDASNKILSVCHPHWKGVRSAAEGQSPNLLLLPESDSEEVNRAVDLIRSYNPSHVILNGFWLGYDEFACAIRKTLNNTRVFYVHHGSFYQMLENRKLPNILSRMIRLSKEGIIERIGFVKQGMADVFNSFGIESYLVLNQVPQNHPKYSRSWEHPVRVFIPATDHLRKNIHTQLVAALMLEEIDEVHIIGPVDIAYLKSSLDREERIVVHPTLSRNSVLDLMNRSTIVLYVTISECAPIVPLESFVAGVPCLSGANHGLLKDNPFLEEMLIVEREDDPNSIVDAILKVKDHYEEIHRAIIKFSQTYDEKAKKSFDHFLGIEEK